MLYPLIYEGGECSESPSEIVEEATSAKVSARSASAADKPARVGRSLQRTPVETGSRKNRH